MGAATTEPQLWATTQHTHLSRCVLDLQFDRLLVHFHGAKEEVDADGQNIQFREQITLRARRRGSKNTVSVARMEG